ncbi:MAG: 5-(carboxyamino)imidazole ribonucleotide synthase [Elusimicrobia bacterium]|nr:5-(carboxyamino)imidazole ribonucleotide synthase [Elusimicrobiota bacterium]
MNTIVGIIGGGQIGKMIAQEARRMAIEIVVLDPTPHCPAATVATKQIVADFKNQNAIRELAESCDILTYEIELGDTEILKTLEIEGFKIFPAPETLRIIQDKFLQKQYLKTYGIPVPEFFEILSREHLAECISQVHFPAILKLRKDSYDGRGNFTLKQIDDLSSLLHTHSLNGNLTQRKYMLEKFVPFIKELSVMVARNFEGEIQAYPVVENIHDDHMLKMTIVPAQISKAIIEQAQRIAKRAIESLNGVGVFGVELFLCANGELLINEIAPRPHNSGHYTIEACDHSQFELHLRSVLNLPLVPPLLLSPCAMLNIIGEGEDEHPYTIEGIKDVLKIPGVKLHLYGKKYLKKRRKLGHLTILAPTVEEALEKAGKAQQLIKVLPLVPDAK